MISRLGVKCYSFALSFDASLSKKRKRCRERSAWQRFDIGRVPAEVPGPMRVSAPTARDLGSKICGILAEGTRFRALVAGEDPNSR